MPAMNTLATSRHLVGLQWRIQRGRTRRPPPSFRNPNLCAQLYYRIRWDVS